MVGPWGHRTQRQPGSSGEGGGRCAFGGIVLQGTGVPGLWSARRGTQLLHSPVGPRSCRWTALPDDRQSLIIPGPLGAERHPDSRVPRMQGVIPRVTGSGAHVAPHWEELQMESPLLTVPFCLCWRHKAPRLQPWAPHSRVPSFRGGFSSYLSFPCCPRRKKCLDPRYHGCLAHTPDCEVWGPALGRPCR